MSVQSTAAPPRAGLRRSIALFQAFRAEQTDPDRFYGALAADSVRMVECFDHVRGRLVVDVGGGPVAFERAFVQAGARYVAVDLDLSDVGGQPGSGRVRGDGAALPIRSGVADIVFCSNLLEHVARPWRVGAELLRVARPGGLVVVSYTNWLSPWGGHETSPWHYLGGRFAARRYERRHRRRPKNRYLDTLFPVSVSAGLRWARSHPDAVLVAAFPRYHPAWARWIVRVPWLREVGCWNIVLVLRR